MTFEDWVKTKYQGLLALGEYTALQAAYLAGVEAERKRCVGIAKNFNPEYRHEENYFSIDRVSEGIAAAIEGK